MPKVFSKCLITRSLNSPEVSLIALNIKIGGRRMKHNFRTQLPPVVYRAYHPFDAVPVLRLLQQTIEAFDGSSEGELRLRFSNGDRLTVAREDGPEGSTIHHIGQPLIVG